MNHYSAYGLTIESEVALPELPPIDVDDQSGDVAVRRGDVAPVPGASEETGTEHFQGGPQSCKLTYDSIGSFLIEDGSRIVFDPVAPDVVHTKFFRRVIENQALGILLHQRGLLVLHASAIAIDGTAAVFIGPRGAGKSTTAAAFYEQGFPVIADDVVAIRVSSTPPTIVPGVSELRLMPDAAEMMEFGSTQLRNQESRKTHHQTQPLTEPVQLGRCYVLEQGEPLRIEDLPGTTPFFTILENSYAVALLSETETTSKHFRLTSTFLENVAVKKIHRPQRHDLLPSLVEMVVGDLNDR
ncbi:phosphoenolpyruvate carboxykinase (ATP) [Salinigranum halophilum]|uniref:hypothetical protein n=1 Tax=Salinigranum halophilum TaxID=2565931 RepID=UPI0010A8D4A0|nr:hypothetical protein [Salinigranum halophilum]